MQLHCEYLVAPQGLADGADGTVDESPHPVDVASKADLDTWSRQHSQIGLRHEVAEIPCGQVILADAPEPQGRQADLSRPSVRAGQPSK